MKKFKMIKTEMDGKECRVSAIQDILRSNVDMSKVRGGYGNNFLLDNAGRISWTLITLNTKRPLRKM